jgi:thiamine biosynthesis protein ThiS
MKSDSLSLVVNGKKHQVDSPISVADLIRSMGFKPTQVVVEWNGRVLERTSLGATALSEGDRLEVIVPVAGG